MDQLAREVPGIAGTCLVCFWFLRALRDRDTRLQKIVDVYAATQERTERVLVEATAVMAHLLELLRRLNGDLRLVPVPAEVSTDGEPRPAQELHAKWPSIHDKTHLKAGEA